MLLELRRARRGADRNVMSGGRCRTVRCAKQNRRTHRVLRFVDHKVSPVRLEVDLQRELTEATFIVGAAIVADTALGSLDRRYYVPL